MKTKIIKSTLQTLNWIFTPKDHSFFFIFSKKSPFVKDLQIKPSDLKLNFYSKRPQFFFFNFFKEINFCQGPSDPNSIISGASDIKWIFFLVFNHKKKFFPPPPILFYFFSSSSQSKIFSISWIGISTIFTSFFGYPISTKALIFKFYVFFIVYKNKNWSIKSTLNWYISPKEYFFEGLQSWK